MKIDKIVFSSSEKYSSFWNLQAEVWSNMGIQPVLLLWGEVKNTDVSDKHGEVIELKYSNKAIKSLQMTWSKFHHTHTEPETTWLIGDIDLFPLQEHYFKENLLDIPEDAYSHLACRHQTTHKYDGHWETHGSELTNGMNLTAYYHLGKGKTFDKAYKLSSMDLVEQVNHIVGFKKYGRSIPQYYKSESMTPVKIANAMEFLGSNHAAEPFWCADESYSSDTLWNACKAEEVSFYGKDFVVVDPNNPYNWNRLDRHFWNGKEYDCVDFYRLKNRKYIDFHSAAPASSLPSSVAGFDIIKDSLYDILSLSKMISR